MTRQDDLKKLIYNHTRRLQMLKEQKALTGWSVDPKIVIEIEDIETEIRDLQIELGVIESRTKANSQDDPVTLISGPDNKGRNNAAEPCILVIDDEPDFLRNVSLTLELAGYRTVTAEDGAQALAMLQTQPVDLILSDITMPSVGGYQLFQRVCENSHWVMIPFIFLTARTLDSDIYYGKELGVDDYLIKPISPANLLSVVRGKLRRRILQTHLN